MTRAIEFRLDSAHPVGCSHHQKIVVIDDVFAICGGIDMTQDRWDRPAHRDEDPDRVEPDGTPYGPWHDITMAVDGHAASAIGDLARLRWYSATGQMLQPIGNAASVWPEGLRPQFENVELAVARTQAAYREEPEVREVERLFLDVIACAKRFLYIENQYFTSPKLAGAIAARLQEDDPPEIVLVGPLRADGWLEQVAMDGARVRLAQAIGRVDARKRFRIYVPQTAGGNPIYVHAKLLIADDQVLKVGSANMNNRSLGLDSECDLAIDGGYHDDISALRTRLLAEHLGCDEATVEDTFRETGSLIETIERLRGQGKTLVPLALEEVTGVRAAVADFELLDPEAPGQMFELPGTRPGLFGRFRAAVRRRRTTRAWLPMKGGRRGARTP